MTPAEAFRELRRALTSACGHGLRVEDRAEIERCIDQAEAAAVHALQQAIEPSADWSREHTR